MASKEALGKVARIRKKHGKKSLPIRVQECELYDWDTTARLTLLVIALGQRGEKHEGKWVQEDCPWTAEEMVGWCDMAQWRIALRVGKDEDRIQKVIKKLEADGVIVIEEWTDSNNAKHNRYQVVEDMINDSQRPKQERGVKRPSRYKTKRGPNKGSFSYANQPGKNREVREMDEEA